jgi:hypothetical protein
MSEHDNSESAKDLFAPAINIAELMQGQTEKQSSRQESDAHEEYALRGGGPVRRLVGPAAINGDYFPAPLVRAPDGQLALSDTFKEATYAEHAKYMQDVVAVRSSGEGHGFGLGLTCPAAGKDGGVRKLSEAMNKVYQATAKSA